MTGAGAGPLPGSDLSALDERFHHRPLLDQGVGQPTACHILETPTASPTDYTDE
jgi:hypothetical protein